MQPDANPTAGLVVAVDGPSGSGKSTTARGVARRLGLRYLDTGAMYRAVTWWMLEHDVPVDDPAEVAARVHRPAVLSGTDPAGPTIEVDGVDVATAIRTQRVTDAVSAVSAVPQVRRRLVGLQREVIGDAAKIVVEGRDIGTVVCPDAALKVYLTADSPTRATRRTAELAGHQGQAPLPGTPATVAETEAAMSRRDAIDSGRATAPLAKADDAVVVDTTDLSLEEAIQVVVELVEARW